MKEPREGREVHSKGCVRARSASSILISTDAATAVKAASNQQQGSALEGRSEGKRALDSRCKTSWKQIRDKATFEYFTKEQRRKQSLGQANETELRLRGTNVSDWTAAAVKLEQKQFDYFIIGKHRHLNSSSYNTKTPRVNSVNCAGKTTSFIPKMLIGQISGLRRTMVRVTLAGKLRVAVSLLPLAAPHKSSPHWNEATRELWSELRAEASVFLEVC